MIRNIRRNLQADPTTDDNDKDLFYDELHWLFYLLLKYNTKIVLSNFNAKLVMEESLCIL